MHRQFDRHGGRRRRACAAGFAVAAVRNGLIRWGVRTAGGMLHRAGSFYGTTRKRLGALHAAPALVVRTAFVADRVTALCQVRLQWTWCEMTRGKTREKYRSRLTVVPVVPIVC